MSAAVFFCVPPPRTLAPEEKKRFLVSIKYEEKMSEPKAWYEQKRRESHFYLEFVLNNNSEIAVKTPLTPRKIKEMFLPPVIPFQSQTRAKNSYMYYGRPLKAVYVNVVEQ
jgi:hypothetical protein